MASPTTVSGISSGIDWQATVDALMQIEYQKVQILDDRKSAFESKKTAWSSIQTKLQTLKSTSDDMDKLNEVLLKQATSSNTDAITVSAKASAVEATHTVVVNQLAKNEVLVHSAGWADAYSTSLTTAGNDFVYTFDGTDYTITLSNGSTIADLVAAINEDTDNPGVTASFIDDGGSSDPVHLVLAADDPSAASVLSINDAGTTIGATAADFDTANWTQTQAPQEAQIRVDGYPPASWITRTTNTIDDVISGVTLNLKAVDASGTTITIANDSDAIKSKIQGWVDAYNDVVQTINDFSSYDSENEIRGVLMDDSQARLVRDQLISAVTSEIADLPADSAYTTLGSIGVDIGAGGLLTVDSSQLDDALADKADEVASVFAFTSSTSNSTLEYQSSRPETQGGTYDVFATYTAAGVLDKNGTNTIGGYAATVEGTNILRGKNGTPVEGLRIWFNSPGTGSPGTASATIRVGNGLSIVASDQVEQLTDSVDGLIKLVQDSYSEQISNLEDQMAAYQTRLDQKKQMLTNQFIAMEKAVSQAKNQANWASSALSS